MLKKCAATLITELVKVIIFSISLLIVGFLTGIHELVARPISTFTFMEAFMCVIYTVVFVFLFYKMVKD